MSGASFSASVGAYVVKTNKNLDVAMRTLALHAYGVMVLRSPVDTGAFRASWRIGVDAPDLSYVVAQGGPNSIPATNSIAAAQSNALAITAQSTVYLTNNAPYALELEYGKSHTQAPLGILLVGTEEVVQTADLILGSI